MYIYCITNILNNKKYVGKCKYSVNESKSYMGSGVYIKAAIKKYGKQNFIKEILEYNLTEETINDREKYWIKELNVKGENGYNLTDGGEGVSNPTEEVRKKISETNKKFKGPLNSRYGKKLSKEHIEALIRHNTGKPKSPETIEKLRKGSLGKKLSKEAIEKLRLINTGRTVPEELRSRISKNQPTRIPIVQIDKKTNEIVAYYDSLGKAQAATNISAGSICLCLKGKLKSAGKYFWKKQSDLT